MEHYAELDVSLELTSVCIVDAQGAIVSEAKVRSEPEALIRFLRARELSIARVGREAGPLSQWIHVGLVVAGFAPGQNGDRLTQRPITEVALSARRALC